MDVALVIRQRLDELQLEQRDLARAAHVTESYVSQILTRKKAPPAPPLSTMSAARESDDEDRRHLVAGSPTELLAVPTCPRGSSD